MSQKQTEIYHSNGGTFDTLPDGWIVADISDFHSMGSKHIGMRYILHGFHKNRYEIYTVTESTTAIYLKPWIDAGRCYVENI